MPQKLFEYKGVTVLVEPQERKVSISPENPEERVRREALAIALGYQLLHDEGRPILFGDARRLAAYLLISPTAYGDVSNRNPAELAETAAVTEEFAQYRIGLDIQNH